MSLTWMSACGLSWILLSSGCGGALAVPPPTSGADGADSTSPAVPPPPLIGPPGSVLQACREVPSRWKPEDAPLVVASLDVRGKSLAQIAGIHALGHLVGVDGQSIAPPGAYGWVTLPMLFVGDGVVTANCDFQIRGVTRGRVKYTPSVDAVAFFLPESDAPSTAATTTKPP